MRAVVSALSGGASALAEARAEAAEGAAREAAALECLRLLRTAFSIDTQTVHRLRTAEAGEKLSIAMMFNPKSRTIYRNAIMMCTFT